MSLGFWWLSTTLSPITARSARRPGTVYEFSVSASRLAIACGSSAHHAWKSSAVLAPRGSSTIRGGNPQKDSIRRRKAGSIDTRPGVFRACTNIAARLRRSSKLNAWPLSASGCIVFNPKPRHRIRAASRSPCGRAVKSFINHGSIGWNGFVQSNASGSVWFMAGTSLRLSGSSGAAPCTPLSPSVACRFGLDVLEQDKLATKPALDLTRSRWSASRGSGSAGAALCSPLPPPIAHGSG